MNFTRFSHHLVAGAMSAALLAGCSAGSQFAPPTAAGMTSPAGLHAVTTHVASTAAGVAGVRPNFINADMVIINNGEVCYYYLNPEHVWTLLYCRSFKSYTTGVGVNDHLLPMGALVGFKNNTIGIYRGKALKATLTGLTGYATSIVADNAGDVFATNAGSATIDYFAAGATTPTEAYADANLSSASYLAMDKANNLYVEGQSASGGIEVDMLAGSGFEPIAKPGSIGATAGGLAVQSAGKATYVWINDQGNASVPANIARYVLKGGELYKESSFTYSGVNGAIAVDPTGKNTTDVNAVNNVASGSEYTVTGVTYSYPSGEVVGSSQSMTNSQESVGIAMR